jgi:hypothetical protein
MLREAAFPARYRHLGPPHAGTCAPVSVLCSSPQRHRVSIRIQSSLVFFEVEGNRIAACRGSQRRPLFSQFNEWFILTITKNKRPAKKRPNLVVYYYYFADMLRRHATRESRAGQTPGKRRNLHVVDRQPQQFGGRNRE